MRTYHIDGTLPKDDELFVFGSNIQGFHSLGAAVVAVKKFGAVRYQGEGRQGNAYAIPTRWWDMSVKRMFTLPLEVVTNHIAKFCKYTQDNPDLKFFVTAVGCGHAGFKMETIVPLFKDAINCSFPEEWDLLLED
jgi:hypothetical protein